MESGFLAVFWWKSALLAIDRLCQIYILDLFFFDIQALELKKRGNGLSIPS